MGRPACGSACGKEPRVSRRAAAVLADTTKSWENRLPSLSSHLAPLNSCAQGRKDAILQYVRSLLVRHVLPCLYRDLREHPEVAWNPRTATWCFGTGQMRTNAGTDGTYPFFFTTVSSVEAVGALETWGVPVTSGLTWLYRQNPVSVARWA